MADHIQIGDLTPRKQYAADGIQIQFTYPFPIFKDSDLEVYLDTSLQKAGYAISGAGDDLGGEVIFDTAPASGLSVTLRRRLTIARHSDFQESGAFRAKVINDELDFLTAALQQVSDDLRRSVQLSPTDPDAVLTLPDQDTRANKFLAFDSSGTPVASSGSIGTVPVSTFVAQLLDDTSASAARNTIDAQQDMGISPSTIGDAGTVLSVDNAGNFQYDATLTHGAYVTALTIGL